MHSSDTSRGTAFAGKKHNYSWMDSTQPYASSSSSILIILLLMIAIVIVSFYEPKWTYSSYFTTMNRLQNDMSFSNILNLRQLIREASSRAKESGSLQTIPSVSSTLKAKSMEFIIVKTLTQHIHQIQSPDMTPTDPLDVQNMEKDLIIHSFDSKRAKDNPFPFTLVLNKFNTIADHCLILRDSYAPQIDLISKEEFGIWYWILETVDAVGFFNSNKNAGASQAHKHLQVVPLNEISKLRSSTVQSVTLPIDDLILPKINGGEWRPLPKFPSSPIPHYIHKIDQFDFLHGIIVFDQVLKSKIVDTTSLLDFAEYIESSYNALLEFTELDLHLLKYCATFQTDFQNRKTIDRCEDRGAYNVIMTTNYLMVVPRSQLKNIENVNGLGFMGILLATSDESLWKISNMGPYNLLAGVSRPKHS